MRVGQSKNQQEAKKRSLEIINNMKQTISKPTIVEAQRTLKILERLIERIGLFLNLDSEFLIKFNEYNNPQKFKLSKQLIQDLSPEVFDLVLKEAKMEAEFKSYAMLEQQIKDGEPIEEEKLQQYARVKKDMDYNFRSLMRSLENSARDLETLKSLKASSTTNLEGFNIYESLSNYKIIMQKTLATAAEEEDSHTRLIEELHQKITSLQKTKLNCQTELTKLRQERAKHSEDKKEEIDKLKSQIREVKDNKEKQIENINKQAKQISQTLAREHKAKEDKLKSEINSEKIKLTRLKDENKTKENKLRTEKVTNESQLVELIANYDKEIQKLAESKETAEKQLKKLLDELTNLKRHFQEIEEERQREELIIKQDKERKERWELFEKKKSEAATRIKDAYRLWKTKNKKKKKKKK